jgi:hypothetical protein
MPYETHKDVDGFEDLYQLIENVPSMKHVDNLETRIAELEDQVKTLLKKQEKQEKILQFLLERE